MLQQFRTWKTIALVTTLTVLAALQPLVTHACSSHGGC